MKSKVLEQESTYDGTQLQSLRNYLQHGMLGDSVVAWIGPCDISFEHMIDGEDLLAQATIRGDRMVHFIAEMFDSTLFAAVNTQRLLASIIKDVATELAKNASLAQKLYRDGDDIYAADAKFSISIATQSPVSSLIHFAVNVTNAGTPVKTLCLEDLQIEPRAFATRVCEVFSREILSIREATRKVRWAK